METSKIVFVGGHHNSALALAKALRIKGYKIYWFGHKQTMRKERSLSLEFQEVRKNGFPFYEIKTGKFYRTYCPWQFFKIFFGFLKSFFLLYKIKPKLVISFGGYLSFPVVLAAFLLRIKVLIHEQTSCAGLANRLLASIACKILLTWSSSKKFFPVSKSQVIGLPLDSSFLGRTKTHSPFPEKLPIILITGGKQGSHVINRAIEDQLTNFLSDFNLIHQTGGILKTGDFSRLLKKKDLLPEKLKSRYLIKKFFYGSKMIEMIKTADLVISRSGGHIVYELAYLAKPAILVPFPWAYNNEQLANAKILSRQGSALILEQKKLKGTVLLKTAKYLIKHQKEFRQKALSFKKEVVKDANKKMVVIIEKMIPR